MMRCGIWGISDSMDEDPSNGPTEEDIRQYEADIRFEHK